MEFKKATERQLEVLAQILPDNRRHHLARSLSRQMASYFINRYNSAWRALPATDRQADFLRQHSQWQAGMTRGDAHDAIAKIKGDGGTRRVW